MKSTQEIKEKMITDVEWSYNYHKRKMQEYKIQLNILTESKTL